MNLLRRNIVENSHASSLSGRIYWTEFTNPKKPKVLILHGFNEDRKKQCYKLLATKLQSSGFHVFLLDLRGFGENLKNGGEFSLEGTLSDIDELMGSEKFYLFGHSYGGFMALNYAGRHPEKIKKLVLSAPYLGLQIFNLDGALKKIAKILPKLSKKFLMPYRPGDMTTKVDAITELYERDNFFASISTNILKQLAVEESDVMRPAIKLQMPVLILQGLKDPLVPIARLMELYDFIPGKGKELELLKDSRHEIFNDQQCEFAQIKMIEFLKGRK